MNSRNRPLLDSDSATDISKIARDLLKRAGVLGKIPTPLDVLAEAADIEQVSDSAEIVEKFLAGLKAGKAILKAALNKLRGLADLRAQAIYVPSDRSYRERFAKAHEIGHQTLPWHKTDPGTSFFRDNNYSLSSKVTELFDIEANFFASEIIFQGKEFIDISRQYRPNFENMFHLADKYDISKESTIRRFVECSDELITVIKYVPSQYQFDERCNPVLHHPWKFTSPSFHRKYGGIDVPFKIDSGHPWTAVRFNEDSNRGEISLPCSGIRISFSWESWWNTYSLFVLLRKKSLLSIVRTRCAPLPPDESWL